jgi:hypothetical protein
VKAKHLVHRLIIDGWATKKEINESYTFMDIIEANAVLDCKAAVEIETAPEMPKLPE